VFAILLCCVASGCREGKIATYPVTGSVTVGGKPFLGARVMLVPVGGSEKFQKERPLGFTDAAGQFQLTTFVAGDGAPAGDYQVMVRAADPDPRKPEQLQAYRGRPRIDPKYSSPETSGLTAKVDAAPTQLPPFAL
jgi:hypothetical protein